MVLLVTIFLLLSLGAVAYPLLAPPRRPPSVRAGEAEEARTESESALAAIRDLEFEYAVGNLSEDDFASLRAEYTERAARVLRRMDLVAAELPQAEPAETEDQDSASAVEEELAEYCIACGGQVAVEDRYCGHCGASLEELLCPRCGHSLDAGDRFCSRCGQEVEGT